MDESKIPTLEEAVEVEFKTAFKGYNIAEVNEFIATQRAETEEIRAENGELYKKIEKLTDELNKIQKNEANRNQILEKANAEADKIIKDAKKRAAQELLRANRQRSRLVADMVAQIDEQKRLYMATKIEAAKFREDLFARYRDHIELINAMSEASGAFDEENSVGISEKEFADMEKLLSIDEPSADGEYTPVLQSAFEPTEGQTLLIEAFSDTASITIPPSVKTDGKKNAKAQKAGGKSSKKNAQKAEKINPELSANKVKTAESNANAIETRDDAIFGEDALFSEFTVDTETSEVSAHSSASDATADTANTASDATVHEADEDYDAENEISDGNPDAENISSDSNNGSAEIKKSFDGSSDAKKQARSAENARPISENKAKRAAENSAFVLTDDDLDEFGNPDGDEMEYDSPVSIDSVFKKNQTSDPDYELLYGDDGEISELEQAAETETAAHTHKKTSSGSTNSYGFKVSKAKKIDPADDSNEFYMESDKEFDPFATEGTPTGTVSSFGISSAAPSHDRRWKVKKSKSLTDEFDAIKADADNDE